MADSNIKKAWSVELCGGTHVTRTGDISLLKIISETAVSGGVRRIEAVTHRVALEWIESRDRILAEAADLLKTCDRAVILSNGKVIASGSPNEVITDKDAKNQYFGDEFNIN